MLIEQLDRQLTKGALRVVIAQIEGGLGSQMWAYAAARRLAIKHNAEVFIDTRNYRTYTKFQPELHHFDVDAVLLSNIDADAICGPNNELIRVVEPAHLHFDKSILEIEDPSVLMRGNYVCEDYFYDVVDTIRKDFTRVSEPTLYAAEMQETIEDIKDTADINLSLCTFVAVTTSPKGNTNHGLSTSFFSSVKARS